MELSHHKLQDADWVGAKPLVFVLDAPQEALPEKKKKTKGGKNKAGVQISPKNFGSWMSITKVKSSHETLKLAWRCRLLVCHHYIQESME